MPPSVVPPGPHPDPLADLRRISLPVTMLPAGASWSRIYDLGQELESFDLTDHQRFNAPAGQFGTLYAGVDAACAFVETFGRDPDLRVVAQGELALRGLSRVEVAQYLRVVDFTRSGLARIRADGRLMTGDYAVAQRWSLALHDHPDQPDGLIWRSRFDLSRVCLAVYDRARSRIQMVPVYSLDNPAFAPELADILDRYDFALV